MSGPEERDGIEAMLRDSEEKRRRLRDRFAAGGKRFDAGLVESLVRSAMAEAEEEGQRIMAAFLSHEMPREVCDAETRKRGYGTWWSAEAAWSLGAVEEFQAGSTPEARYEIRCRCRMGYQSAHFLDGEDGMQEKSALIVLALDEGFRRLRLEFRWAPLS